MRDVRWAVFKSYELVVQTSEISLDNNIVFDGSEVEILDTIILIVGI